MKQEKEGRAFKRYLFEYAHDGEEWGIEVAASSPSDARDRVRSLYYNGALKGEIAFVVKIPTKIPSWISRVISIFSRSRGEDNG
jgi:hypothetical protein